MRVSLDLDGVVYDFDYHIRNLWRGRNPDGPSIPSRSRFFADTQHDLGFDTMAEALDFYTDNAGWVSAPLIPGAYEGVRRLMNLPGVDLWVITARPRRCVNQTHAHLHFDFDIDPNRVILADRPKWEYGMDLYIEDSPTEISHYRAMDVNHVIFDQPWNRHIDQVISPRVVNWPALVQHVTDVTQS